MPIIQLLWKYRNLVAIATFFILWLGQIAYTNHLSGKLAKANAECVKRINKVNDAYQQALDAWKTKVFIVENELETERNNIKIQFRDIKHETQKIITERVYTECKLDDAGMSNAETARIAANTRKPNDTL